MQSEYKARVLILGGTTLARELAEVLSNYREFKVITSFAGRTQSRMPVKGKTRVGGFNGANGLADYLRYESIDYVVDATHAFATNISVNAARACDECNVPRLILSSLGWEPEEGDNWIFVNSHEEAVRAANKVTSCDSVFLAVGRQEVTHYFSLNAKNVTARMIELPDCDLPATFDLIQARGPFSAKGELALLKSLQADLLICKNAGGEVGRSKLDAARELKITVVMLQRPNTQIGNQTELVASVGVALTELLCVLK